MRLATRITPAVLLLALSGGAARAHELRPALLSIEETAPEEYRVEVRRSLEGGLDGTVVPVFPAGAARVGAPEHVREWGQAIERYRVRVPGGWEGRPVSVRLAGVPGGEVLVRAQTRSGRVHTGRLVAGRGDWILPREPGRMDVARTYTSLGVEHILTGLDHLAFVLGLILLTPAWRQLWKSVTAFTVAHSLTLALAALGMVHVPQPPVEAVIALSILLVARQAALAASGRPASAARRPWPMAFAFGLLHGLGFAGALAEVGLPDAELPLALFTFNVGVELGQLAFVAVVLMLRRPLERVAARGPAPLRLAPAYAIGATAAFWCLQRVAAFWS